MLQRNGEDIASKSVFNEANLKEHLRGKTADELIEELEKLYDEEELTGEEFDPRIVEIYIEAMEKVSPPDPAAERAFDRSWALFHTKHRVEKEPSSSHRAVKIRWRIEAAVLIVIFLCVSAAAFGWKDYIITWKDELFGTVPHIPGTMELKEPNVSGYRSLKEAVQKYTDISVVPGWIPPGYTIDEIYEMEVESADVISATYRDGVKPPDYSDAGNAAVFSRIYQNDIIFVDALGWLWWNGKHWERDDHKATAWALELSEKMLQEAKEENRAALLQVAEATAKHAETGAAEDADALEKAKADAARAKAYLTHAKNSRNAVRIKNMLELSKPALVIKADKLDANPFDLNTPAGIVELTTGRLRPHERGAYCSQITQTGPDTKGSEMWSAFLDTITCGDGSVRGFLQLVAGMSLIGAVYQEGIIIAYGGGRNGKSTYFNALGAILGDYTGSIDIKVITTDRGNKGAALATLRGRRLVVTGELEEHQRLSVATLKQLASTDRLVIEEKFKQPETVKQTHTLVLFTNHLPRVGSTDNGTWRRLIVVPFNATIPAGTGIQNYADVLVKEAGGSILSWAIEGAVNFVRNGFRLDIPEVVEEATEAYRAREDWLTNFINERCVREPNARVGAADLYREYREWAEGTGDYVRRLNDFTTTMEAAGFQNIRPKNKSTWVGLRLDLEAKFGTPYAATV